MSRPHSARSPRRSRARRSRSHVERFLAFDTQLGRAPNTITAYRADLTDYLAFCRRARIDPLQVTHGAIVRYLADLRARPGRHGPGVMDVHSGAGLRRATLRRRLSAVRSWYAFLVGDGVVRMNPVPVGQWPRGRHGARGLVGRDGRLPWVPSREEWQTILRAAIADAETDPTRRNLTMLLVQYDGALRREELVQLRLADVLPLADHTITVRAETTKGRRERRVYYSPVTAALLAAYVDHRLASAETPQAPLFVSAGPRHEGGALSASSYTKVTERLAARAGMPRLTTHTMRHLRLTHLALAEWDLHEIKTYAGHATIESTLLYVHLGQPHIRAKYVASMARLDAWVADVMHAEWPGEPATATAEIR